MHFVQKLSSSCIIMHEKYQNGCYSYLRVYKLSGESVSWLIWSSVRGVVPAILSNVSCHVGAVEK